MTIEVVEKKVLYFGCRDGVGHYLQTTQETLYSVPDIPGFPWTINHLDGGLLRNGLREDVYDGKVFSTCGGIPLWHAFYWWDNSIDRRSGSNSGFYVRGFGLNQKREAFDYACSIFPHVVERQKYPLELQL